MSHSDILCPHWHLWKHNPYKVGGFNEFEDARSFCQTPVQIYSELRVWVCSMIIWHDQSCQPRLSVPDCVVRTWMLTQGQLIVSKHFIKRKWEAFRSAGEQHQCPKARSWRRDLLGRSPGMHVNSGFYILSLSLWFYDWITQVTYVKVYPQNRSCFCLTKRP